MTEDPRISEIRAVLDEDAATRARFQVDVSTSYGPRFLSRIRAIVDREPPALEPWQMEACIREQRATSLGYCEQVIEEASDGDDDTCGELRKHGSAYCEEHQPAPRVFLPDDQVPVGTVITAKDGSPFRMPDVYTSGAMATVGATFVEVFVPSPEEWQAAVDRARAERPEVQS